MVDEVVIGSLSILVAGRAESQRWSVLNHIRVILVDNYLHNYTNPKIVLNRYSYEYCRDSYEYPELETTGELLGHRGSTMGRREE